MKIGVCFGFQNDDRQRYLDDDFSGPPAVSDAQVYEDNLYLSDLIEPLGFDSMFAIEHHGSPHHLTANPLDMLKYWAGRTSRIELGTCLIVLPWHHPLRLAEEIAMVDHILAGRKMWLGIGRGSAPREFTYLGLDIADNREMFAESVDILRLALSQERFSYKGKHWDFENIVMRPKPRSRDICERLFAGVTSDESIGIVARMGLGIMFSSGKSPEEIDKDMALFNGIRAEQNLPPDPAVILSAMYCSDDENEAREVADRCFTEYMEGTLWHYQFPPEIADHVKQLFVRHALYGTPEQLVEKISVLRDELNCEHVVMLTSIGGMTVEESERSLRLVSEKVLPVVHGTSAK
jgi:alkanesulfonate monooxygenase SsuD/methylene tetrahydromethanopterin reductase-like flavin-dependent oxidoreductase (luciferase family)